MSTSRIAILRNQLDGLEKERADIATEMAPLNAFREQFNEIEQRTSRLLFGGQPLRWDDEKQLKEERGAAYARKAEVDGKIIGLKAKDSELALQLAQRRTEIIRLEYDAVTPLALKQDLRNTIAELLKIDQNLAGLMSERNALQGKLQEAQDDVLALTAGEAEQIAAEDALNAQRAKAFIDGQDADLESYAARLANAEERIEAAKQRAVVGAAALPLIGKQLERINLDFSSRQAERVTAENKWWAIRARQAELKYLRHVDELLSAIQEICICDRHTANGLARTLHEDLLRKGLTVPVLGKHAERPARLHSLLSDLTEQQERLQAEFDDALEMG